MVIHHRPVGRAFTPLAKAAEGSRWSLRAVDTGNLQWPCEKVAHQGGTEKEVDDEFLGADRAQNKPNVRFPNGRKNVSNSEQRQVALCGVCPHTVSARSGRQSVSQLQQHLEGPFWVSRCVGQHMRAADLDEAKETRGLRLNVAEQPGLMACSLYQLVLLMSVRC
ncbi:uncharacterized [Tachysurus ichikawai]